MYFQSNQLLEMHNSLTHLHKCIHCKDTFNTELELEKHKSVNHYVIKTPQVQSYKTLVENGQDVVNRDLFEEQIKVDRYAFTDTVEKLRDELKVLRDSLLAENKAVRQECNAIKQELFILRQENMCLKLLLNYLDIYSPCQFLQGSYQINFIGLLVICYQLCFILQRYM